MCEVVPWFNTEEWFTVYHNIFTPPVERENLCKAVKQLNIWKLRCPSLPAGIEATFGLLSVQTKENNFSEEFSDVIRLAFSHAIIRFVNHMLDEEHSKTRSFYSAAIISGIPDWIIDLRHETSHNNTIPSLEVLQDAARFCMDWLHLNYWSKHKAIICDYVGGAHVESQTDEEKIKLLIHFFVAINLCYSCKNIKYFGDIKDIDMRKSLLDDSVMILDATVLEVNPDNISIINVINKSAVLCKKYIKEIYNSGVIIAKELTDDSSLFMSHEMVELMSNEEFRNGKLSEDYLKSFDRILLLLHSMDQILPLVMELLAVTRKEGLPRKSLLAALWLHQILHALYKSSLFLGKIKKVQMYNQTSQKKNLVQLFCHWYPKESEGIFLNLDKPAPNELTDMTFVQPILSGYNPYLKCFIADLLKLIKPQLPQLCISHIFNLAYISNQNIISNQKVETTNCKIHTVKDLRLAHERFKDSNYESTGSEEDSTMNKSTISDEEEVVAVEEKFWLQSSAEHNWAVCPLGTVPWHTDSAESPMDCE